MHTHSDNSPDGGDTVIGMCESAVAGGLGYLAVTDHCEINKFYEDHYDVGVRQSYFEMKKARSVFWGELVLLYGVELGQATADIKTAEKVLSYNNYDVVLGSMHSLPDQEDFAFLDYTGMDVEALFDRYLDEVYKLVEWGGFDVLTHLTYPLRYINGEQGHDLKPSNFAGKIERILNRLIQSGRALELNTSGLRQPYGVTLPDKFCVDLYRSLGGELITLGSDAHRGADVAAGIEDGLRLIKAAGFDKYYVYRNRKPIPMML